MLYINEIFSKKEFCGLRYDDYFVDKTGIISAVVPRIGTPRRYICITRPRRFGKTTNARTLACFLSRGLDAADLFDGLEVSKDEQAMKHLGAHDVIYIDFSKQPDDCTNYKEYIGRIKKGIISDLCGLYPQAGISPNERDIFSALKTAFYEVNASFCFVMDEWDSMFFDDMFSPEDQSEYLKFLKQLLKDTPYVDFAYMTGILPIAKHSTGSELNMFDEFSAVNDPLFYKFFGFTEDEVHMLCDVHAKRIPNAEVDFEGLVEWYDGYITKKGEHMFNPRSVVLALSRDSLDSFWTESGPYDEIYYYVRNDIDDIRDDLVRMVAGESVRAEMENYAASSMSLTTKDEILSAMVVYGFLTYYDGCVSIPNHELMLQFQKLLKKEDLGYVAKLAQRSEDMLCATLNKDTETMTQIIEAVHDQEVPLLNYTNEADLAALINLVYLHARDRYFVRREQPAGKGVADVAFIPQNPKDTECRPFIVELKASDSAAQAIKQIRNKNYTAIFEDALTGDAHYAQPPLAVGIAWDPKTKAHECIVEEL